MEIFVKLVAGLWPLLPALVTALVMRRKAISDGFKRALNEKLNDEAWVENTIELLYVGSTLGAVVAGNFAFSEQLTTAFSVGSFIIAFRITYALRVRAKLLKEKASESGCTVCSSRKASADNNPTA